VDRACDARSRPADDGGRNTDRRYWTCYEPDSTQRPLAVTTAEPDGPPQEPIERLVHPRGREQLLVQWSCGTVRPCTSSSTRLRVERVHLRLEPGRDRLPKDSSSGIVEPTDPGSNAARMARMIPPE